MSKSKPTCELEVVGYCLSRGLIEEDGSYMWNHWHANGFKNGRIPVKDWQAQIRAWQLAGYFPSQKPQRFNGSNGHHQKINWTKHNKVAEASEAALKLKQTNLWPTQNL